MWLASVSNAQMAVLHASGMIPMIARIASVDNKCLLIAVKIAIIAVPAALEVHHLIAQAAQTMPIE